MSYKTIVVHLEALNCAVAQLTVASEMARQHQAHLIGLYVTPPAHTYFHSEIPVPEVIESYHASYHETLSNKLREQFRQLTDGGGFAAEWRHAEAPVLPVALTISELTRTADLLITGQTTANGGNNRVNPLLQNIVLGAGRPVLVVPGAQESPAPGKVVLLAWDGGSESTRAVFDALPILKTAEKVIVHRINPESFERHHLLGTPSELVSTLSRHGVVASLSHSDCAAGEVGTELLQTAFEQGADLLVMGGYGKHRFRDLFAGSTTRSILSNSRIPVLMSH